MFVIGFKVQAELLINIIKNCPLEKCQATDFLLEQL